MVIFERNHVCQGEGWSLMFFRLIDYIWLSCKHRICSPVTLCALFTPRPGCVGIHSYLYTPSWITWFLHRTWLYSNNSCVYLDTRGTETSLANSQTANVLLTEGTSIRNIIMPTTAVHSLFNVTDGRRSVSLAEGIVNNNNPTLSKWSCERDSSECLQWVRFRLKVSHIHERTLSVCLEGEDRDSITTST